MNRLVAILAGAILAMPAQSWAQKTAGDPVYNYTDADAEMNGAVEQARHSYPQLVAAFRADSAANRGRYMIKVGLPTQSGGHEHIWVNHLHYEGEALIGALANAPDFLPGMALGSRVEVRTEDVSDWSITRAEGMYGNFTTRVMLDDVSAEEAASLRRVLTPNPLPADWQS